MLIQAELAREKMIERIPEELKDRIANTIKDYACQGYTGCDITYGLDDVKKYDLETIHGAITIWLRMNGYNAKETKTYSGTWVFAIDWVVE